MESCHRAQPGRIIKTIKVLCVHSVKRHVVEKVDHVIKFGKNPTIQFSVRDISGEITKFNTDKVGVIYLLWVKNFRLD